MNESGQLAARARIAMLLLAAGADPNECVDSSAMPGGKYSALAAAARDSASPELVAELLSHGALLEPPGSTAGPPAPPLVSAALGGNLACVQMLLSAGAPEWQAREALEIAIERDDSEMAKVLLDHGCLPDHAGRWRGRQGGCLHAALALGRDLAFLRMLLDGGATVGARDRDGRTPLAIAVELNALEAAELFRARGAAPREVSEVDRFLGACFAGDAERADEFLGGHPGLLERCGASEHQNVCRAVRRHDQRALAQLLRMGFDANAVEDGGETASHVAVQTQDIAAAELLVAHGASPERPNYEGLTALELAALVTDAETRGELWKRLTRAPSKAVRRGGVGLEGEEPEDAALLAGHDPEELLDLLDDRQCVLADLFEHAVELTSGGDLPALSQLLEREPRLATSRSPLHHRATLLHYLGNNGTERRVAPENTAAIAELLLERGAEVDASCNMYGGGPNEKTLGLAATTDQRQYSPGVLEALIGALVRGGAMVHEHDGRSGALEGAMEYGATIALGALRSAGARAYNVATAAALDDLDALDAHLEAAPEKERVAALEAAAACGLWPRGQSSRGPAELVSVLRPRHERGEPDSTTLGAMAPREIVEAALALPLDERLELAEKLVASVHAAPEPEWEEAWVGELDRRTTEYERTGEGATIDEAFAGAMARVNRR